MNSATLVTHSLDPGPQQLHILLFILVCYQNIDKWDGLTIGFNPLAPHHAFSSSLKVLGQGPQTMKPIPYSFRLPFAQHDIFLFSAYDQADGYTLYFTEGELDVCTKGESRVGG